MNNNLFVYKNSNSELYLSLEPSNDFCNQLIQVIENADFNTLEKIMVVLVNYHSRVIASYFLDGGGQCFNNFIKQVRRKAKELTQDYERLKKETD